MPYVADNGPLSTRLIYVWSMCGRGKRATASPADQTP